MTTPLLDFSTELSGTFTCYGVAHIFESGRVLFTGDVFNDLELFFYDPISDNVEQLTNFKATSGGYGVDSFLNVNDKFFFNVNQGLFEDEKWKITETTDSLQLERVGTGGFLQQKLYLNNNLYIQVYDQHTKSMSFQLVNKD